MAKQKLENVGEEQDLDVTFEDFSNPESTTDAEETSQDPEGEVTHESEPEPEPTAEETSQTEQDLENAGINRSDKSAQAEKRRETTALMTDVRKLGEAHGAGKTSMIGLAERVTEAAMKRAIAPSDAGNIYDKFRDAANKKGQIDDSGVIPDDAVSENAPIMSSEESRLAQVSKLGNFIELGNKFDVDASDLVRRARNIHLEQLKGDRKTLMKGSTYTILVSVASANVKRKSNQGVMTDDEIHKHLWRPAPVETPKDGIAKLEQALDAVKAAKKGSKEREAILNPRLDDIISELRQAIGEEDPARLQAIEDEEAKAEADRKAKEDAKQLKEDERNAAKRSRKAA